MRTALFLLPGFALIFVVPAVVGVLVRWRFF
jgi:hypothetical protein